MTAIKAIVVPPVLVGRERFFDPWARLVMAYQPKKPLRLRVEIAKPDRTERENRYLWAVPYTMLSQHTGMEREEIHEWNCGQQWGWKDRKCPKTPRNPSGIESTPIRSTTINADGEEELCAEEDFIELWRRAQQLGASLGIVIPDPDPALRTVK